MPVYEYECAACGPFSATRRLAEYKQPQPCPDCGAPAPRAMHTAPACAGMSSRERGSREPASSSVAAGGHSHGPSCGCH